MSETEGRHGGGVRRTVRDLKREQRGLFALVGLSALMAGGVAVFESSNQAGTVALLAVGSASSVLAVVGKVPLRWVIGGHEFDMSEDVAIEAIEVVASQLKPSETAELAGRLADLEPGRRSPMTHAILDYVAFEQMAIGRVMQAIAREGWTYAGTVDDRGIDGLIVGPEGISVPVEYKLARSPSALRRALNRYREVQGKTTYFDLVLITGGSALGYPRIATELAPLSKPRIHLVELDDPEFEKTLLAVLRSSFQR